MVSLRGMLMNKLQTSDEIKNLSDELTSLISLLNENESFAQCSLGITGSNMPVKTWQDYNCKHLWKKL